MVVPTLPALLPRTPGDRVLGGQALLDGGPATGPEGPDQRSDGVVLRRQPYAPATEKQKVGLGNQKCNSLYFGLDGDGLKRFYVLSTAGC